MLPNFLIIGAAKSGTTSLYHYLNQHPQIFMCPVKEVDFFAYEGETIQCRPPAILKSPVVSAICDYRRLFDGVGGEKAVGEVSVGYLYRAKAADRIWHHLPDVKLVAVLRDPVERAFSHYLHQTRDGHEILADFESAIAAEPQRIRSGWAEDWHYVQLGYYNRQLETYYRQFPAEQLFVRLFDDFKSDPVGFYQDLCRFLEVDERFKPDMSLRYNATGIPRNRWLHDFLTRPHPLKDRFKWLLPARLRRRLKTNLRNNGLTKPDLRQETAARLRAWYRPDLLRLERLIDRDLSMWLA